MANKKLSKQKRKVAIANAKDKIRKKTQDKNIKFIFWWILVQLVALSLVWFIQNTLV